MNFERLEGRRKKEAKKRITQRDLIPKAVKLRNSEIYQLGEETIIIYDRDNDTVLQIDQDNTKVGFGGTDYYVDYSNGNAVFNGITGGSIDVDTIDSVASFTATTLNCTTLNATTISGLYTATEIWFAPIIPQWTDSWTVNAAYTDIEGSIFDVNFDDIATGWDIFFDIVGKTDAGTAYWQLYNVDDTEAVENSEISTASTDPVNLRSDALTMPEGTVTLKVQHKIVDGDEATEYVNSIMGKLVLRLSS